MFTLVEKEFRPFKTIDICTKYYYIVNDKNQIVDKRTLKPYRGKKTERYTMVCKVSAEAYLEVINKQYQTLNS